RFHLQDERALRGYAAATPHLLANPPHERPLVPRGRRRRRDRGRCLPARAPLSQWRAQRRRRRRFKLRPDYSGSRDRLSPGGPKRLARLLHGTHRRGGDLDAPPQRDGDQSALPRDRTALALRAARRTAPVEGLPLYYHGLDIVL